MTKKKAPAVTEPEQPFLPGFRYNSTGGNFTEWTTSVRPELTEDEIDRMDCAPEIKKHLKFTAKCNFDGKILSIFPVDGVIHLHGREDVRNLIQALIVENDEVFHGIDVTKKDYTKIWEQCAELIQ